MRWILTALSALVIAPASLKAGAKEDFIEAVVEQCKLPAEEAATLATPGRTGTVVQFKVCLNQELEVKAGCTVICSKAGSKIGQ